MLAMMRMMNTLMVYSSVPKVSGDPSVANDPDREGN